MTSATRRLTWGFVNVLDKVCIVDTHSSGRRTNPKFETSFKPKKMLNKTLVLSILITALTNGHTSAYAASTYSQDIWKLYMHNRVVNEKQYNCINKLWTIESHWNNKSKNRRSTAYGIAQVLGTKTSDPFKQIDAGLSYIAHRFKGDGCAALAHHRKHGHY
jgi:hypothetical protein